MNERWLEILLTPMRDQITVAETCRRYGISRQSFYVNIRETADTPKTASYFAIPAIYTETGQECP